MLSALALGVLGLIFFALGLLVLVAIVLRTYQ